MTPEIGTHATAVIHGEQVPVLVCGVDDRHGVRVSNQQWGGKVDTWIPATDLTTQS